MKSPTSILVAAMLVVSSISNAAEYEWTGAAGDNWDTPGNWQVTGSLYTWPHEQYGAGQRWVNDDCEEITIATGQTVDRFGPVAMSGASAGNNTTALSIKNHSTLDTHSGDMWIGQNGDGTVKVEVTDESLLSVHYLIVGDAQQSTGLLEVANGAVNVATYLYVGKAHSSTGKMEIKRDVPVAGYDLTVGRDLIVGSDFESAGSLEGENSRIFVGQDMKVGDADVAVGTVEVKNSSVEISRHLYLGRTGNAVGMLEIKDGSVEVGRDMYLADFGDLNLGTCLMKNSTLQTGARLFVGSGSVGLLEVNNSVLHIGTNLIVGRSGRAVGTLEIKDSIINILAGDLRIPLNADSGTVRIGGNSTIVTARGFKLNYGSSSKLGELVMNDGQVNVESITHVNFQGGVDSQAGFTLNGGTWDSGGDILVGNTPNGGNACLTINGGTMVTVGTVSVGNPSSGQSRIFLNGGLLQAEAGLSIDGSSDSLIVYRGGELWIKGSSVGAMEALITAGRIDVPAVYEITTIGDYTVLRLPM